MNRKIKGITLIALIITIIVLLILAGVSISLVLNQNGVIDKSKEAKTKYQNAANYERDLLDTHGNEWIENFLK